MNSNNKDKDGQSWITKFLNFKFSIKHLLFFILFVLLGIVICCASSSPLCGNWLLDLVLLLVAITALSIIGFNFKKSETNSSVGTTLIIGVIAILMVGVYYLPSRGLPAIKEFKFGPQGVAFLVDEMSSKLEVWSSFCDCDGNACNPRIEPGIHENFEFKKEWDHIRCKAISNVSKEFNKAIKSKGKSKLKVHDIFKIVNSIRTVKWMAIQDELQNPSLTQNNNGENKSNFEALKLLIAELVIIDNLFINEIESLICS